MTRREILHALAVEIEAVQDRLGSVIKLRLKCTPPLVLGGIVIRPTEVDDHLVPAHEVVDAWLDEDVDTVLQGLHELRSSAIHGGFVGSSGAVHFCTDPACTHDDHETPAGGA